MKLKKQGMNEVIVDLRGNGGGYLEMAVAMADEFFEKRRVNCKNQKQRRCC